MRKTLSEKIADVELQIKQLTEKKDGLISQYNEAERKVRTKRICERGELVEKLLPDLARLTKEQFDTFVEKTLLTEEAERILKALVPPIPVPADEVIGDVDTTNGGSDTTNGDNSATSIPAETAGRINAVPVPKPTLPAHNGGVNANTNRGNAARRAS